MKVLLLFGADSGHRVAMPQGGTDAKGRPGSFHARRQKAVAMAGSACWRRRRASAAPAPRTDTGQGAFRAGDMALGLDQNQDKGGIAGLRNKIEASITVPRLFKVTPCYGAKLYYSKK